MKKIIDTHTHTHTHTHIAGLPYSDSKESSCNSGDLGSIPGSGRSPREGNGYLLQYFCLKNSTDRGAWLATVHGITESDMTEQHSHLPSI